MQENVMGIAIIFVRVKKAANVAEESTPLETPDLQID
jgi:hypothetical protein